MVRFVLGLILFFIVAKVLGVVIAFLRQALSPPRPQDGVEKKTAHRQFDNIEDAEYEDITEKKK